MDLNSMVWPRARTYIDEIGRAVRGFGGTVYPKTAKYYRLDNAHTVLGEVREVEKIEAPLEPEKEKEQRQAGPPLDLLQKEHSAPEKKKKRKKKALF